MMPARDAIRARIAEAAAGIFRADEIDALTEHAVRLAEQSGKPGAVDGVVGMVRLARDQSRRKMAGAT